MPTITVQSNPVSFALDFHNISDPTPQHPSEALAFPIPDHVYTSGLWRLTGVYRFPFGLRFTETFYSPPAQQEVFSAGPFPTPASHNTSNPVSAEMLSRINSVAGGNLTGNYVLFIPVSPGRVNDDISFLALDLTYEDAPVCTYAIAPNSASYPASGGAGTVAVTTQVDCPWEAIPNNGWLHVTAGSIGTGSGTVFYSVDINTEPTSRVGTITIAGFIFTVTQAGHATHPGRDDETGTRAIMPLLAAVVDNEPIGRS